METLNLAHGGLPKLSTSKELCRRDSLSSARTRDSGYNSDLDSLSPLEVFGLDQDLLLPPLPCVPKLFVNNRTGRLKSHGGRNTPLQERRAFITSHPPPFGTNRTLDDTQPSAIPELRAVPDYPFGASVQQPLTSDEGDIERWIKENLPSHNRPKERVSSIVTLSSTSSCEMYTDTDMSEDEQEQINSTHALPLRSIHRTIELIIRKVEVNLRVAAYKQCTNNNTSHSRARGSFSSGQSNRKASQSAGSKRKSRSSDSPPAEESSEEGPNKRRRGSAVTITDDSDPGARFACPFYKHDPDRYRHQRTCPGPGWPTVHRMKEHLYRSHSQPIFCPICYETFKSDKDQSNHVRLQQCTRSAPQHIEGIDRETVWHLRKRTTAMRLEEDKWRDVYHLLFPDVPEEDIPSPFYDCDSPTESSRRFRRDLLRRIQHELLVEANQVPTPVEQHLLQRVAGIIRRCENDLLNPTPLLFSPDRRPSQSSIASSYHATPGALTPLLAPELVPAYGDLELRQDELGQFGPQTQGEVGCVPWEDQTFSLGIDWEGVFPSAAEMLCSVGGEGEVGLVAPVWT